MMPVPRQRRRAGDPEAGFVMLMVFVMAAVLAIMLYMELPRVSFEAQRNKEELLIERGEQYKRAIQLYFRKFRKYPTSMEQLESTNNLRFLRRRYLDPLTGKDEWRLIHIGPTGAFLDSLTQKPNQDKDKKDQNLNTFITEGGGIGAGLPTAGASGQPARRASEQAALTAALDATAGGALPNPAGNQLLPGQFQNQQGGSQLPSPIPPGVVPVSGFNMPAQSAMPGQAPDGSTQSAGSGFGTPQGQGFGSSPGQGFGQSQGQGFGSSQGQGFGQQQGFGGGQGANQAANLMLSQLLTTPRNNFVTPGPGLGTPAVGGGIAGVASTVERTGIKIYNDRSKYNEWEFIYDFGKDRTGMGQLAGQLGSGDPRLANGAQGSQSGFGSQGGVGVGQGTGFGAQSGMPGGQTGFGGTGGSFGQQGAGSTPGGIGSSTGGIGSGYGGGIGSAPTPAPGSQAPAQPVQPTRQPTTPQPTQPGQPQQPPPQQSQPVQPQPVQPPQAAPPPPPPATPPAQEPDPAPPPAAEPPPQD
jgi:type II secretory pathway pseudopilin PulG